MKLYRTFMITTLIAFFLASSAHAAGYMKLGDIKGEANREASDPASAQRVDDGSREEPAGLLVPAVQKALPDRDSQEKETPDAGKKKGNVEYEWKVEEGQK